MTTRRLIYWVTVCALTLGFWRLLRAGLFHHVVIGILVLFAFAMLLVVLVLLMLKFRSPEERPKGPSGS
jgi:hypothetical protein